MDYGFSPVLACCALGAQAALGCTLLGLLSLGAPLLPLGHAMHWERTLPYGGSPPSSGLIPRAVGARGPSSAPSSSWLGGFPPSWLGMPCAGSACCRAGGFPPSPWLCPRAVDACGPSPTPSCPRAVCTRGWGGSPRPPPELRLPGGSPSGLLLSSPPYPCCALWARAARWGVPLPRLPLLDRSRSMWAAIQGGPCCRPSSVGLPRSKSSLGSPLLFLESPSRGVLLLVLLGVPLLLLRCTPWARAAGWGFPLSLPPLVDRSR